MQRFKQIMRVSAGIVAAAVLGGCAAGFSAYGFGPNVEPASRVKINTSFDIPINRARVYFQGGQQVAWGAIDRHTTYCSVLVQNVQYAGQPQQTVSPGTFDIVKVRQRDDDTGRTRIFVASAGDPFDFPSNVTYEIEMRLQSGEQPDVRSLFCAKRVDQLPRGRNLFPKLDEMRAALGELIEIIPPA